MDKQQHIHELIDQYLMGELIGQELDKFKIRLKDDPAFLQQVQIQKAIINSVDAARKAQLKALLVASKQKKKGLIIPFGNKSLALAASILSLLAFGLIIKTMMPFGNQDLSQSEKKSEQEITATDSNTNQKQNKEVVTSESEEVEQEPDSVTFDPSPEIAIVEEITENVPKDKDVLFDSDDDVDLAELKKNEDEIDGDEFKAKRDSMLGSKTVPLYVVAYTAQTTRATETQEVTKKDGLFNRKNKDKDGKAKEDAEETTTVEKSLTSTVGTSVRVEFWESIVKFKGYKYDGSKLLLFDTPETTPISLKSFGGTTFLNKNGIWYRLVPNSAFNQMLRVSDADVLKVLNTK